MNEDVDAADQIAVSLEKSMHGENRDTEEKRRNRRRKEELRTAWHLHFNCDSGANPVGRTSKMNCIAKSPGGRQSLCLRS